MISRKDIGGLNQPAMDRIKVSRPRRDPCLTICTRAFGLKIDPAEGVSPDSDDTFRV